MELVILEMELLGEYLYYKVVNEKWASVLLFANMFVISLQFDKYKIAIIIKRKRKAMTII